MKAMETIQDLIEEAKVQTVWWVRWGLCIFSVTYFLTNTSKSMWMNLPMAIIIIGAMNILLRAVSIPRQTRLSYLENKQLSVNDASLSGTPPPPTWKKKINSRLVEAAMNNLIDKILNDFVMNLWYSAITPDKEAPELIRGVLMNTLGEISVRVKEINIVDLLTRDMVDLIGDHLEMFRKKQTGIGIDVMEKLTSEQRDERLKSHLMASGELYPALVSPESEYKVLQKMVDGIFSVVLPQEERSPLVRTMLRELFTCLVTQPVMHLACPELINKLVQQHKKNQDGQHCLKLKCRVLGAYFEELGSESFAVYFIEVKSKNKTWSVKRRYSNFERLHSQLINEIPDYNLQLPPDLTFSSSTDDDFAYRRCFPLDKYLQDLLCIANVAEHNEVRDFISEPSKPFVKTVAVTADDAVDNIARGCKWIIRKIAPSSFEDNDHAPARSPMNPRLLPILNLVEKVFHLKRGNDMGRSSVGEFCIWILKLSFKSISFVSEDFILNMVSLNWLRNEDRVAQGIHLAQDILWPNGVFFKKVKDGQEASDETELRNSSVQQSEASGNANEVEKLLSEGPPPAFVSLVGEAQYMRCVRDISYFTQSNVCIKQLTFAILELLLRSVFPELRDVLRDIRESGTVGQSKTVEE